jgi:hypothetical protein
VSDLEKKNLDTKEKIILPINLQREMMKFFLRTSMPKIAERNRKSVSNSQQTSPKAEES